MKTKINYKLVLLILLIVAGLFFMVWGYYTMMHYENFREIWRAARKAAFPKYIIGIILLIIAYIDTYTIK